MTDPQPIDIPAGRSRSETLAELAAIIANVRRDVAELHDLYSEEHVPVAS